uniref:Peptidase A2 domain-containing protein n=1 Tax=Mycena chlorophos TaxID=658473 RepID=A0ABQ0LBY5_MYCCL|nr:predicted protein [Mycena chlorophos]
MKEASSPPKPPESRRVEKRVSFVEESGRAARDEREAYADNGEAARVGEADAGRRTARIEREADVERTKSRPKALRELPYKFVRADGAGARTLSAPSTDKPRRRDDDEEGGKAYRLRAPIQREGLADEVLERINNTEVTVRLGDLLGLSSDLREGERMRLTRVRQPLGRVRDVPELVLAAESVKTALLEKEQLGARDEARGFELKSDAVELGELPKVKGVFVAAADVDGVPAGSLIAQDPYLQYLEGLEEDEHPKQIYVARDSGLEEDERPKQIYVARDSVPLRVTFPFVNGKGPVECVLDSGSQIVSMSLEQAQECGLIWDPTINIYMQSANGQLEKSMGLAKNVPFRWGELKLYLQVHVIRGPAYKVLLGPPFDVLTKSRTDHDGGNQILTLTDPNSGRAWTVPTYDRVRADSSSEKSKAEEKPVAEANMLEGFRRTSRI